MLFVFFATAIALILLVIYSRKCHKYWRNRGVSSTSPKFLVGDMGKVVLRLKLLPFLYDDIYKAYPRERMVGFYEFTKPNLLIRDPQLIESILIKDFSHFTDHLWMPLNRNDRLFKNLFLMRGKRWKDLRTKFVTTFSANKMKSMAAIMDRCAEIMNSILSEKCSAEDVDVMEIISRFATDVIGCCVFGLQFNTLKEPDSEFRKVGQIIFKPTARGFVVSILRMISPKILALLNLTEFPNRVEIFFETLLRDSEEFRKTESTRRADLMQLILDIRDRDQADIANVDDKEIIDDVAVLSNMMLFYTAGFATTANALSWCLYELALHPEIQQKLRTEVQTIFKNYNEAFTYDSLKSMTFTEMVINDEYVCIMGGLMQNFAEKRYESVASRSAIRRVCTSPYLLPGTSCVLQPGDKVTISIHSLHHDEKYYPDPDKFDPYRFTPENVRCRPSQTFMPFGDGPRICLAARFAKMEMKICLARIISQFKFSTGPKTDVTVTVDLPAGVLTSKNGIHLRVSRLSAN